MAQSRSRKKRTVQPASVRKARTGKPASVRKAQKAVTALRDTIGLPSGPLAREIAAKVRELSREKRGIVEWEVRVLRPGETVEALCNCHCYA